MSCPICTEPTSAAVCPRCRRPLVALPWLGTRLRHPSRFVPLSLVLVLGAVGLVIVSTLWLVVRPSLGGSLIPPLVGSALGLAILGLGVGLDGLLAAISGVDRAKLRLLVGPEARLAGGLKIGLSEGLFGMAGLLAWAMSQGHLPQ